MPLVWSKGAEYLGSDRVVEQHRCTVGPINLWIEAHTLNDQGQRYETPKWVFWWYFSATPGDIYCHSDDLPNKQAAEKAAERLVAMLLTLPEQG